MPRHDCGPHRAEWRESSCFCSTTHQTYVSLYDVMLSSRSTIPGCPICDTHRTKRPTYSSKPTYEIREVPKRCGILTCRRRASPRTQQALRPHRPRPRVLETCPVSQAHVLRYALPAKLNTCYPNLEGSFLPELSCPWLLNARARTTGTDPQSVDY
ncbi:hypothetical protein TNCT_366201 [Trichonephila clavata]|uniref:Uncharacterized protein n=1 Tax=Trichonephila clavata TaxID=2740835 RepID=A0A8X6FI18_TRICU|nr:hypothetical protein TNCT_366201 [Trichonephila clavata]